MATLVVPAIAALGEREVTHPESLGFAPGAGAGARHRDFPEAVEEWGGTRRAPDALGAPQGGGAGHQGTNRGPNCSPLNHGLLQHGGKRQFGGFFLNAKAKPPQVWDFGAFPEVFSQ